MEEEMITPFSNGSEAMNWYCNNCDRCTKAFHPKNGEYPSEKTMKHYISIGKECKMKYYIDWGFVSSEIPLSIAEQIGYDGHHLKYCMFFSDDENDRFHYPKKPRPKPESPDQLLMPFELNEIVKDFTPKKELSHS